MSLSGGFTDSPNFLAMSESLRVSTAAILLIPRSLSSNRSHRCDLSSKFITYDIEKDNVNKLNKYIDTKDITELPHENKNTILSQYK